MIKDTMQNIREQAEQIKEIVKQQELIKEFEYMKNMAELKALSNYSLENSLNENQFKRIMELKELCLK